MSDELKHELKHCPWCKYPPVLTNIIKDGTWYAECFDSGCERHMRTAPLCTKASAIDAWNLMVEEQVAHDGLEPDSNLPGLKPCNYCEDGGEPRIVKDGFFYVIGCNECGYTTGAYYTQESAIAAWNARAEQREQSVGDEIKIGNEVYVHGYVDEIRRDTVIIRNDGGYFGTVLHEVTPNTSNTSADDAQVIKKAENYKLDDDSRPQVITNGEKYELADSREQLEADVNRYHTYTTSTLMWPDSANAKTDWIQVPRDKVLEWLDRQAAITRAEVFADGEFDCMTCGAKRELQERVDSLTAERELLDQAYLAVSEACTDAETECGCLQEEVDELTAEVEAQRKRANDAERGVLNKAWYVSRDRYEDDIAELKEECDKLLAELEAYRDFEKGEFAIPLDEAMKFTTDPPGYIKKHIAELQAERDKLQSIIDHMPKTEHECEACQEAHDRILFNAKLHQDDLRDKLAEKQHVCDVQRESFRKMERLLADAKAADYMVMRDEAEKLRSQVAELKAENRDLCMKIYGAPF